MVLLLFALSAVGILMLLWMVALLRRSHVDWFRLDQKLLSTCIMPIVVSVVTVVMIAMKSQHLLLVTSLWRKLSLIQVIVALG